MLMRHGGSRCRQSSVRLKSLENLPFGRIGRVELYGRRSCDDGCSRGSGQGLHRGRLQRARWYHLYIAQTWDILYRYRLQKAVGRIYSSGWLNLHYASVAHAPHHVTLLRG